MSSLALALLQPAQAGDKARSDFVLSTYNHLPGAVVRGAFAAAWIAAHGVPQLGSAGRAEFVALFEGGVRFGPLFAEQQVTPLSVAGHKYAPEKSCGVAEYDRALHDGVPARCPECRSPLEPPKRPRGTPVAVRRRTSVAIATSGVALSGKIVTRDTLQAGQVFRGTVAASDPALLDALAGLGRIRVGGRRTTHGMADVRIDQAVRPATAQRRDDGLLVVRLRSPGVFVDDQGRPSRDPHHGELEDVLGCPARVVRRWARWCTTGGWHIASGLAKPVELAVAPGSTYLIETSQPVTDERLAALGERGLGLRRHEGFGDLAPPPALEQGRDARESESRRRQGLLDSVAALRGLAVARPLLWQPLLAQLAGHAAGDTSATERLRRVVGQLDQHTARALAAFLDMELTDAVRVAGELRAS